MSFFADILHCKTVVLHHDWPGIRDSQLRRESGSLHLEANIPDAFRMLALAGQFGSLLLIGTGFAAVFLLLRYHTVASRMFAFVRRGHEYSFYLNMPSLL